MSLPTPERDGIKLQRATLALLDCNPLTSFFRTRSEGHDELAKISQLETELIRASGGEREAAHRRAGVHSSWRHFTVVKAKAEPGGGEWEVWHTRTGEWMTRPDSKYSSTLRYPSEARTTNMVGSHVFPFERQISDQDHAWLIKPEAAKLLTLQVLANLMQPREGVEATLRVFAARPASQEGWAVDKDNTQACGFLEEDQSLSAPVIAGCASSYYFACLLDSQGAISDDSSPSRGKCSYVELDYDATKPLLVTSLTSGDAAQVSRRRHILEEHDVAFLVLVRSTHTATWRIGLHISAYEAGAVCSPDSFSILGGVKHTITPFITLPLQGVNITVKENLVTFADGMQMSLPAGDCLQCSAGKFTEYFAAAGDSECRRACGPGFFSASGLDAEGEPCKPCPVGWYNDQERQRACTKCPDDLPLTNAEGAKSVGYCWFAQVGIEEVKAVGRKLKVIAFAVIRPASFARTNDILAVFKDQISSESWRQGYERQLAWVFTSIEQSPSDESFGTPQLAPGSRPASDFSFSFLFPSAGPGMYSLKFYSNSSDLEGVSLKHGGVMAEMHFRVMSRAVVPGLEWEDIGLERPSVGTRFFNKGLSQALLSGSRQFTIQQLTDFGLPKISFSSYVKVGDKFLQQEERWFKPVEVQCSAPEPAVELGDPSIIFMDGCVPPDNREWEQEGQGLMCARGSFSLAARELASISLPLLPKNFSYHRSDIPWDEVHDRSGARGDVSSPPMVPPADTRASWSPCKLCPKGYYTDRPGASGCWPCTGSEIAPEEGSVRCQPLNDYAGTQGNPPSTCQKIFESCKTGSSCWTCLSLCCDPCLEFYRRSETAAKAPTDCPIDQVSSAEPI